MPDGIASSLELLFRELTEQWLTPQQPSSVTNEAVLRELSLPPDAETRLCYFALPPHLHSRYREIVFPVVNRTGLVPASGDELNPSQGNVRALLDSLLHRAHAVVGDVTTDDSRVWNDLRAAAQRLRPPPIAVIAEPGQKAEIGLIPGAHVFVRSADAFDVWSPEEADEVAAPRWLDSLTAWLEEGSRGASIRLEDEANRLLEHHMYRPAVIAASSAVEVALREQLEARWWQADEKFHRLARRGPSVWRLTQAAVDLEILSPSDAKELQELQAVRNTLVHTREVIDGRRARGLVQRAMKVIARLRAFPTDVSLPREID